MQYYTYMYVLNTLQRLNPRSDQALKYLQSKTVSLGCVCAIRRCHCHRRGIFAAATAATAGNTIVPLSNIFALRLHFAQFLTTALKTDSRRKLHTETALKFDNS